MSNTVGRPVVLDQAGQPISKFPLLILVGVTGVGKSTTLSALKQSDFAFTLLPDRRDLTDTLIIRPLQIQDGDSPHPVKDRLARFEYTRRYRQQHHGGMAHALSQLRLDPACVARTSLCFDGLRGADEVSFAALSLPLSRFVVLDAPDMVRLERLLGRGDTFDRVKPAKHTPPAADFDLPGAEEIFTASEIDHLHGLVAAGAVEPKELAAKVSIVVAERRNYNPAAAIAELQRLAPERTLIVDTSRVQPPAIAQAILTFWRRIERRGE